MTEFQGVGQPRADRMRAFVFLMVIVAGMFFGLRWYAARGVVAHAAESRSVAGGSMNVVERELFVALAFVQGHVVPNGRGSWGWAVVILTVGINAAVLPLRFSSMKSGVEMQRLQPQVQAIKARYKDVAMTDPRHATMTGEILQLQKDNGVQALGGCLPLLIQMPLLLAFFGMLRKAAPLHGAGWLWLHDLSAADPYHVLPALMVVLQVAVQWVAPSPGADARQQKGMAVVMAVGFAYVSWHYAAAVALYSLTGSVFSLVTQAGMNRLCRKEGGNGVLRLGVGT